MGPLVMEGRRCVLCGAAIQRRGRNGPEARVCQDGECAKHRHRWEARKWWRANRAKRVPILAKISERYSSNGRRIMETANA